MIGYLIGTPLVHEDALILQTSAGVGYEVFVAPTQLPQITQREQVELHIYTHVREDVLQLFGFPHAEDKKLFQLLLSVSGIGPKTALILSARGAQAVIDSVQQANVSFFTTVPRVGKKLAKKIILELGSKVGTLKELSLGAPDDKTREIIAGLVNLGFSETQAEQTTQSLDPNLSTEAALKAALTQLHHG